MARKYILDGFGAGYDKHVWILGAVDSLACQVDCVVSTRTFVLYLLLSVLSMLSMLSMLRMLSMLSMLILKIFCTHISGNDAKIQWLSLQILTMISASNPWRISTLARLIIVHGSIPLCATRRCSKRLGVFGRLVSAAL